MNIEQLNDNHFEEIKRLLLESSLPVDDISHAPVLFFGITESSKLIAMGGLELYQPHAILRSATVSGEYQSKGIGSKLCNFLEEKAREMNIEKLFLLNSLNQYFQLFVL